MAYRALGLAARPDPGAPSVNPAFKSASEAAVGQASPSCCAFPFLVSRRTGRQVEAPFWLAGYKEVRRWHRQTYAFPTSAAAPDVVTRLEAFERPELDAILMAMGCFAVWLKAAECQGVSTAVNQSDRNAAGYRYTPCTAACGH